MSTLSVHVFLKSIILIIKMGPFVISLIKQSLEYHISEKDISLEQSVFVTVFSTINCNLYFCDTKFLLCSSYDKMEYNH